MRRSRGGIRWGLLGCAWMCALLMLGTAIAEGTPVPAAPLSAMQYISFQGETLALYPWYGDKIVLLTRSGSLDEQAIRGIVTGIDAAYTQYHAITGREPTPWGPTVINGRSTIAEVPDGHTCGAGCAYVGFTGIEIMSTYFGVLYDGYVQHGQYDQVPFYELGRNFWFYGDQLATEGFGPFVTGFAIANRFISMELADVPGGPFGSLDFATFKQSIVVDLLNSYLADARLNWENTLNIDQAPPNPYGWSAADLAGGMLYRVFHDNGLSGYHDFFVALARQPRASSAADVVNNFIHAAYTATGRDYTYLFVKTNVTCPLGQGFWKNHPVAWPVSSLVLGSQTYTQAELLNLFDTPVRGDASLILADQLIAAKLNLANDSDPAPIRATIVAADALLSGFAGKLPYSVRTSSATGQVMLNNASTLDTYNNGQLTPGCVP